MLDLGRTFLQAVERSPHAPALLDADVQMDYAQWAHQIARACAGLHGLGLRRGDHLLVALLNRWQMATLHWACQFLGVVVTPLNWRATPEEVEYCALDSEARAIVFEQASAQSVAGSTAAMRLQRLALGDADGATARLEELLLSPATDLVPQATAEDVSLMLYTSGTTGRPKGVPRRHRQERAAALAHVAQNLYRRGERTLGVMPLYHTMGVRSLLAMSLVDGLFACMARFQAEEALRCIEEHRITCLYLVPTLYHDILGSQQRQSRELGSVRKIGFAGAPMPDALLQRVHAVFQPDIFVNHYGSSEVYTFTVDQDAVRKAGSAGRAGINARIRVVRLDATSPEQLAAVREEGQIIADLAGDEAFEGYWKRPDADAKALWAGWYFTGDTGFFDDDGDLHVTGRIDDMIISGGENISPADVESVLALHPDVEEVAVAGVKDERWGQRLVAFVRCRQRVRCPSNFAFQMAALMPPWIADRHAC